MSRYDKYEPFGGGFRAPLEENWNPDDFNTAFGVGLNANGRVVKGAGVTGVLGVLILQSRKNARDIVDVMTDGEIVEFPGDPGSVYVSDANGAITAAADPAAIAAGSTRLGHTVEGSRLVVRAAR